MCQPSGSSCTPHHPAKSLRSEEVGETDGNSKNNQGVFQNLFLNEFSVVFYCFYFLFNEVWPKHLPVVTRDSRDLGDRFSMLAFPRQCRTGESCSCVLGRTREDMEDSHFVDLLSGRDVKVTCSSCLPPRVSLHGAKVIQEEPFMLQVDQDTQIFPLKSDDGVLGKGLVELCAGIGAMGTGPMFLHAVPLLSWDHCALATQHLATNGHGRVLTARLDAPEALLTAQKHLQGEKFVGLIGFPCQPYSSQGRGLGSQDERASVLTDALRNMVFLNPQAVLLECVHGASQHQFVRQNIQAFCEIMDFHMHETKLNLNQQWPMARYRWWCILAPKSWQAINLQPWPTMKPQPIIEDIMPSFGMWSLHDEHELLPTKEEWADFTNPMMGDDIRLVDKSMSCPTVLHSYAATHSPCPCGCRSSPFSRSLLCEKGLRGFMIRSAVTNVPRFLFPLELALLLGIPPMMKFDLPVRSSLCLLGNVASPMQSLWVYSHLLRGAAVHSGFQGHVDPQQVLLNYKTVLRVQSKNVIVNEAELPRSISLHDNSGSILQIWSQDSSTVAHLLRAESITLDWGHKQSVTVGGVSLPLESSLDQQEDLLMLERKVKKQKIDAPQGTLAVAVIHDHTHLFAFVEAGQFMFEALRQLHLDDVNWLVDEHGTLFSADFRVWESGRFFTLSSGTLPDLRSHERTGIFSRLKASGPSSAHTGLSANVVHQTLQQLLAQVGSTVLLLEPFEWRGTLEPSHISLRFFVQTGWTFSDGRLMIPFVFEGHWWLLFGKVEAMHLTWTLWDGMHYPCPVGIRQLVEYLTGILGFQFWELSQTSLVTQPDTSSCGTVVIVHACHLLGLAGVFQADSIKCLHQWLCQCDLGSSLTGRGPPDPVPHLAEILATKGVAYCDATERAQVGKLGKRAVQEALLAKNPWAALKQLASKPHISYKFIKATELENHIKSRAKEHYGASTAIKAPKSKKKTLPLDALEVDPRQIVLAKDYFEADNKTVPQIEFSQVIKDAIGIAVCSAQEAVPFTLDQAHLSSGALALLVISAGKDFKLGYAKASEIKFTATYKATAEPILLPAWLLQLGDVAVARKAMDDPMATESVSSTAVVKLQAFRDEIEIPWEQLSTAPIRTIFQVAPCFTLCRQDGCGPTCKRFHQAVDEDLDAVVHEVWARRFQKANGTSSGADKADVFQVYLRIQAAVLEDALKLLVRGLYVEPRSSTTKGAHPDYAVIWLSDATAEEALHKLRCTPQALSLVRLRQRYGLRVETAHEKEAFELLRPNTDFIKVAVQKVFHLHPLPFGLQRAALIKLLKEWSWSARPLQVAKGSALGGAWTVGAETDPPGTALPAFGKEVLINCIKSLEVPTTPSSMMIPKRTEQHIRQASTATSASASTDPWLNPKNDPWHAATYDTTAAQPVRQRLTEISKELKADMQTYVSKELSQAASASHGMDAATEQRFQRLESGISELQVQSGKYQNWFQEAGTRLASTEHQLQVMSGALATTQDSVRHMEQEVKLSSETFTASLHTVKNELSTDMSRKFDEFTSSLESLLSKKQRTEN